MRDFLGNKIREGDEVVYLSFCRTSSSFKQGKVSRMTQKCAYIDSTRKEEHKIISLTALKRSSINREAWKPCEKCDELYCSMCKSRNRALDQEPCFSCHSGSKWESANHNFCGECGRPLNEQAWEELEKRLDGAVTAITELLERAEKAERERDAAVRDINLVLRQEYYLPCVACKNSQDGEPCEGLQLEGFTCRANAGWRGVQEE